MQQRISLTFDLVTPAYAGSVDLSKTDGLRPPTLKALLRFWWRTMKPELGPAELFAAEERLFGSTRVGQRLRVVVRRSRYTAETRIYEAREGSKLFYMAYGADHHTEEEGSRRERIPHQRVPAGATFPVDLLAPSPVADDPWTDDDWREVLAAVWLLSAFGGFGRRSRRGFGGLQVRELPPISNLPGFGACRDPDALAQAVEAGLQAMNLRSHQRWPEHTSFWAASWVAVGPVANDWESALSSAASVFYDYRRHLGTTYQHSARGEPSGADFQMVNRYLSNPPPPNSPSTVGSASGLPQQFTRGGRPVVAIEVFEQGDPRGPRKRGTGRRASPVFFKVVRLAPSRGRPQFAPAVLFLPAQFMGTGRSIEFNDLNGQYPLRQPNQQGIRPLFKERTDLDSWDAHGARASRAFQGFGGRRGWQVF